MDQYPSACGTNPRFPSRPPAEAPYLLFDMLLSHTGILGNYSAIDLLHLGVVGHVRAGASAFVQHPNVSRSGCRMLLVKFKIAFVM